MEKSQQKKFNAEIITNIEFEIYNKTLQWWYLNSQLRALIDIQTPAVDALKKEMIKDSARADELVSTGENKTKNGRLEYKKIKEGLTRCQFEMDRLAATQTKYAGPMEELNTKVLEFKDMRDFYLNWSFKDIPQPKQDEQNSDSKKEAGSAVQNQAQA